MRRSQTRIQSMEMAFRMQTEAPEAFDLSHETQATRDALRQRATSTTAACSPGGWSSAACASCSSTTARRRTGTRTRAPTTKASAAARVDQPIAALLKDLKQRGLARRHARAVGRRIRPHADAEGTGTGRDHNHYGFSVWLAGGGVKGGMTYGATDEFGFTAVENRMHVHDLHATMLHLMGLDHERLTYRYSGRDFRLTDVHGKVAKAILA